MWNPHVNTIFIIFFLLCHRIYSQTNINLPSDAKEYVDAHNHIRINKGVGPLTWDPVLAAYAKNWASQRADDCNPFIHSPGDYGENIMWELYDSDSPTRITEGWADEERNFDYHWHRCKCRPETMTCKCGHFTQVIWRTTARLGCGNYTCNNQKGFIVVCSYDPPGNYIDEDPFWPSDYYGPTPPPPPPPLTSPPPPPPPPPPMAPQPPPPPTPQTPSISVQPLPKVMVRQQPWPTTGQQMNQAQPTTGQQLNQAQPTTGQQLNQAQPTTGQQLNQAQPTNGQQGHHNQAGPGGRRKGHHGKKHWRNRKHHVGGT